MTEMRNSLKYKVGLYLVAALTVTVFIFAMMLVKNNRGCNKSPKTAPSYPGLS